MIVNTEEYLTLTISLKTDLKVLSGSVLYVKGTVQKYI